MVEAHLPNFGHGKNIYRAQGHVALWPVGEKMS